MRHGVRWQRLHPALRTGLIETARRLNPDGASLPLSVTPVSFERIQKIDWTRKYVVCNIFEHVQ
jgi:hypothetical protein